MKSKHPLNSEFIQKLAEYEKKVINYPAFKQLVDICEEKILEADIMPNSDSLLVLGESRVGKTTIAKHIIAKYPRYLEQREDGDQLIVPAFYCQIPARAKISDLAAVLLRQLGMLPSRRSEDPMDDLIEALSRCKTKIIFLDEIHHIFRVRGEETTLDVRNWIKNLLSAIKISVVFLGLPKCEPFVRAEDQLDARIPDTYRINPFTIPHKEDMQICKTIESLDKALCDLVSITLLDEENIIDKAQRFCIATGGRIGRMRILIKNAAKSAYKLHSTNITLDMLAQCYAAAPPSTTLAKDFNPFLISRKDLDEKIQMLCKKHP